MNKPLVSVVVPTYHRTAYLAEAIASAVGQSYENLEIIVADDGNTAAARQVAASFNDPRVSYQPNDQHQGMLRTNIAAFARARGKYAANLHDDDAWEPDFIESLIPALEDDPNVVVAFSDHCLMDEAGRIDEDATRESTARFGRDRLAPGVHQPFVDLALLVRAVPMVMAAVVRRDAIPWDEFPVRVGPLYDLWLSYLASREGGGAYYEPRRLTRYRYHADTMTASRGTERFRAEVFCCRKFLDDPSLRAHWPALRRIHAAATCGLGIELLRLAEHGSARRELWKSLQGQPTPRALQGLLLSLLPPSVLRPLWSGTAAHGPS